MSRNEFLKRIIRYVLYGLLVTIAIFTGTKASFGANCSSCPGRGICTGETDCSTFLNK